MGRGVGNPVPRTEDARLLQGRGQYTDDIETARPAVMRLLRSPYPAALILGIDTSAAAAMPGVLAVLTGDDVLKENFAPFASKVPRHGPDGKPNYVPVYRPLCVGRVGHVGDPVAAVIAETMHQAMDACEAIEVEYEVIPAVTDTAAAAEPDAPIVWPDLPDNRCFVFPVGDKERVASIFARADHVVGDRLVITRMATNSLEGRAAIGQYDRREERYTLHSGLQSPHSFRQEVASVFRLPANKFRVVSLDVGGAFGMKGSLYPEQILVLWAARLTGRTVKWTSERTEAFLSDHHARDNVSDVELALDKDGRFLALRVRTIANIGAYIALNGLHSSTNNIGGLTGVYVIPAFDVEVTGVFSNTNPTCPFRGAGRPEASYCIERIIDLAARRLGIDPPELRRRNMIPASAMPYKTGLVFTYDCGEFEAVMDKCLAAADWAGFPERRAASADRGKLRGIGIACVVEIAGGPQQMPLEEAVEIRFDATASASVMVGSHSNGQGHETVYRQMAHELLGLEWEEVRVVSGDTDAVFHGRGTFGSRTMMAAGTAFVAASKKIIEQGTRIAAHLLEASAVDIEFAKGVFSVAGTDRRVTIQEVARTAYVRARMPTDSELGLQANAVVAPAGSTFPNGCHICEVEIDPETGVTELQRYTVVDDVGNVVNPLLLKGQIHGGVAQGAGQALMEEIVYDDGGQILSASFMDYAMPRAGDLPMIGVTSHDVPTETNPLGVKGAGEAGTVGALPSVMNAVADALYSAGVARIDMPATPHNVWRALAAVRAG